MSNEVQQVPDKSYRGKDVQLCADGKYRWVYEMNLLTNPFIFLTVLKIFVLIIIGIWFVFGFFLHIIHGDLAGMLDFGKTMLIMLAIFTGLTILGVLVLAALYGGKYVVLFEMDEKEVKHIQMPKQFKKAQAISLITAMVGIAAKKPSTVSAGLLSAGKSSSTSEFKSVRRVIPRRLFHVIKVNQLLNKNHVYVPKEDYDFVYDFIKTRCINAK
jgi:hypothetical protein